jgi:hypothetical protein
MSLLGHLYSNQKVLVLFCLGGGLEAVHSVENQTQGLKNARQDARQNALHKPTKYSWLLRTLILRKSEDFSYFTLIANAIHYDWHEFSLCLHRHQCLMLVILATQEAEIRRFLVWSQQGLNSSQDPILKNPSQKRAGEVAQAVGPEFKP